MKVVIAIDSFKGSMDSIEAGEAAAEGVKRIYPDAETVVYPLADGAWRLLGNETLRKRSKKECTVF